MKSRKNKWEPKSEAALIPVTITKKRFEEMLDEVAEVLYLYFCQLDKNSQSHFIEPVTDTKVVSDLRYDKPVVERTGTDD